MTRGAGSQPAAASQAAFVAVLSALLVFSWTAARVHYAFGGNWSAVFCTGSNHPIPPDFESGTYRFKRAGYDGQFYRYLAHDPFLQKGYAAYVDYPLLRFRRMLVPLAAWLLAFGQPGWIDAAYIAVEIFFVALGGYWCARLLVRRGRSPLWGFLFLLVPATLASFDRMLVDGPLLALFAGFLLYCEERRWTRVWVLAMLAALTRETGLLVAAALATDRLWHRDWRRAACFAASAVPAAAWYMFVAARLPHDRPVTLIAAPGWGILRRLLWLRTYPDPRAQVLLQVTDVLAVLGLIVSIAIALRWILGVRLGPVTLCAGYFVALAVALGSLPGYMTDAFGFARPVSPLLLWIVLEAVSRKEWIAMLPPLLPSLSVGLVFGSPFLAVVKGLLGR